MGTETQPIERSRFDFDSYRGVDDHNWAEFPLFSVTKYTDRAQQTLTTSSEARSKLDPSQTIVRTQKMVGSQEYGLPGDRDGDVMVALMSLVKQRDIPGDAKVVRLYYSPKELIRFMRWPDNGKSYRDVRTAMNRWLSTSFRFHNWWDDVAQKYRLRGWNVLTDFTGYGDDIDRHPEDVHYAEFTRQFIEAFTGGWSKTLDLDIYYRLRNPTAKLLFRFLDKRGRVGQVRHFDLRTLATQHLGIKGTNGGGAPLPLSRLRDRLHKGMAELIRIGFIVGEKPEDLYGPVKRKEQQISIMRGRVDQPGAVKENPLVAEMVELGMWEDEAYSVITNPEYGDDFIRERIELVHWKIDTQGEPTPKNPGAYLKKLITHPRPLPANFETRQQKSDRIAREKATQAKRQKQQADAKAAIRSQSEQERKASLEAYQTLRGELHALSDSERTEIEKLAIRSMTEFIRPLVWKWIREGREEENTLSRDEYVRAVRITLDERQAR